MIFDGAPQEIKDGLASIVPKGRMGQPSEVAILPLSLASDDSGFVTGIEACYVDGGTHKSNLK